MSSYIPKDYEWVLDEPGWKSLVHFYVGDSECSPQQLQAIWNNVYETCGGSRTEILSYLQLLLPGGDTRVATWGENINEGQYLQVEALFLGRTKVILTLQYYNVYEADSHGHPVWAVKVSIYPSNIKVLRVFPPLHGYDQGEEELDMLDGSYNLLVGDVLVFEANDYRSSTYTIPLPETSGTD